MASGKGAAEHCPPPRQALSLTDRSRLIRSLTRPLTKIFTGHGQLGLLVDPKRNRKPVHPPGFPGGSRGRPAGCRLQGYTRLSPAFRPLSSGRPWRKTTSAALLLTWFAQHQASSCRWFIRRAAGQHQFERLCRRQPVTCEEHGDAAVASLLRIPHAAETPGEQHP